jgi:flagellar motor switch protein FliM
MENPSSLPSCPPGYIPAGATAAVQRIHRLFLKALEMRLGESLQAPLSAALADTRQGTLGSCLSSGELERSLIPMDILPNPGVAVLSFPSTLLRAVLDILLANPTGVPTTRSSHITEIEAHILRDFFEAFTGTLRKAWATAFAVAFNRLPVSFEDAKQLLGPYSGESALMVTSKLKLAGIDHSFDLVVPGFLIRLVDVRATSAQTGDQRPQTPEAILKGPLGAAVVEIEAVLRGATLRMGDLLTLKQDQILFLGAPVETPFDCLVNGKVQFSGQMAAGSNGHCFQVESTHPTNLAAGAL